MQSVLLLCRSNTSIGVVDCQVHRTGCSRMVVVQHCTCLHLHLHLHLRVWVWVPTTYGTLLTTVRSTPYGVAVWSTEYSYPRCGGGWWGCGYCQASKRKECRQGRSMGARESGKVTGHERRQVGGSLYLCLYKQVPRSHPRYRGPACHATRNTTSQRAHLQRLERLIRRTYS